MSNRARRVYVQYTGQMTNFLAQANYAELEQRVLWFYLTEFEKEYPGRVTLTPPDCVLFEEGAYGEFREFCKRRMDGAQRSEK